MNVMTQKRGFSLRAIIAVALAAGLVGMLALMLASAGSPATTANSSDPQISEAALPQGARYPDLTEKFAPGRIAVTNESAPVVTYAAPCHGEGLLDPQIQELLIGDNQTVAQYCEPKAYFRGGPDAPEPGTGSNYPELCHGEGLMVPMDPAAYNDGPGSVAEFCKPDTAPADESNDVQTIPDEHGPSGRRDY